MLHDSACRAGSEAAKPWASLGPVTLNRLAHFLPLPRTRGERQGCRRDDVGTDLADDQLAGKEALRLLREIEDVMAPGDKWRLTLRRDVRIVFRIEIKTTGWLGATRTLGARMR
jgi:hypothetical protein